MATDIRRRQFISVLGSAAVWPLALRAQQADKMRRIGVLPGGYRQTDPEGQARLAAFLDTLGRLGWSDGRNVRSRSDGRATRWTGRRKQPRSLARPRM